MAPDTAIDLHARRDIVAAVTVPVDGIRLGATQLANKINEEIEAAKWLRKLDSTAEKKKKEDMENALCRYQATVGRDLLKGMVNMDVLDPHRASAPDRV